MDLIFCFFCFFSSSILLLLILYFVKGSSHSNLAFGSSKRKFFHHLYSGDMNNMMQQNLTERLRPLVGLNGWDYCVYWKLSEDQRFLEWLGCCCAGTENNQNCGEEHIFHVSSCRDTMFPHQRTKACDLLSQLNTSISMDSPGIHAQTLLTNQSNWLTYPNSLDPNTLQETINGTHVLIPVPGGGLVELFVTKQVGEDQQVIDFITSQCIAMADQQEGLINHSISINMQLLVGGDENEMKNTNNHHFNPAETSTTTLPHDISVLNFMQHFNYNRMKNDDTFSEEYQAAGSFQTNNPLKSNTEEDQEHDNKSLTDTQYVFVEPLDSNKEKQLEHYSMSDCSDQNEEEDDGKYRRRNGKGNQSKNLVAERKRRKKLNDRLYNLRSLVPRISKLDRASILGDAIEYVKDLQKQVKELQDELEENSDIATESNCMNGNNNQYGGVVVQTDIPKEENGKTKSHHVGTSENGGGFVSKHKQQQQQQEDVAATDKQTQQMEPQVEVAQIDGNEYFVKVFCEHKAGGFVKLMEALTTLGMDVVHATVTSHKGLVSNVFKVEKKDSEIVEAEDVRDSLLELTRNRSTGTWTTHEIAAAAAAATSENNRDQLHNHHMGVYHSHHFHN